MEKRYRDFDVEVRQDEGQPTKICGYPVVFDMPSVDLGGFVEVIKHGALDECMKRDDFDVIANFNHDDERMLARFCPSIGADTLTLKVDDHGLYMEYEIPETADGQFLRWHVGKKNLRKMSFCFIPSVENTSDDGKTVSVENIESLHDVSVVIFPAYESTEVELREKPAGISLDVLHKRLDLHERILSRRR